MGTFFDRLRGTGAPDTRSSSAPTSSATETGDPQAPKGRPTPSRKEAEAARKQSVRMPKDPKAAKAALRERERAARAEARAGMAAGDSRYFPPRDQGPVRAYVRDFVDTRYTTAEYFLFVAVGVLVFGFIPNLILQQVLTIVWFALTALIIIDTAIILIRLSIRLKRYFPEAKDRKGTKMYAAVRALQFRRLRQPPPRLKRGQAVPEPVSR
jgi:hypothetical protein